MDKQKYNWIFGENGCQKYYEVTNSEVYLCVFENNWQPDIWMGMVGNILLHDKTANDRQRKKQGLPRGCHFSELRSDTILCNKDPEYMMKKVIYAYEHGLSEISR